MRKGGWIVENFNSENFDIEALPDINENSSVEEINLFIKRLIETTGKDDLDSITKSTGMYGDIMNKTNKKKFHAHEHEIFVKVIFEVISTNNQEHEIYKPEVIEKNYYIPLPSTEDYKKFINIFDTRIKNSVEEAASTINKNQDNAK